MNNQLAKSHIVLGLVYGLAGLLLGVVMALSGQTQLVVVHAHYLLIGTVFSCLYGVIIWTTLADQLGGLLKTQAWLHHTGTIITAIFSPFFYGGVGPQSIIGPILGVAALLVVGGLITMLIAARKIDT